MTFNPPVTPINGLSPSFSEECDKVLSLLQLFGQFWSIQILRGICSKTNRYATEKLRRRKHGIANATCPNDNETCTHGGIRWNPVDVGKLKAFIAIFLYMGLKKLPNIRMYWEKSKSFLYCHVLSQLISCNQFLLLSKCLHITNLASICVDHKSLAYDKVNKVRWLLNELCDCCKALWNNIWRENHHRQNDGSL